MRKEDGHKIVFLDIETTYTGTGNNKNPEPHLPTNKLVSVGINEKYLFFHHNQLNLSNEFIQQNFNRVQFILDNCKLLIGHNIKFDLKWLWSIGFRYDGPVYDTMVFEYILARGTQAGLKLKECCLRRGLSEKLDVLDEYLKDNINVDDIPVDELELYGRQDVKSLQELYYDQLKDLRDPENRKLIETLKLSNQVLLALARVELNGTAINQEELNRIEKEYLEELTEIDKYFNVIIPELMGDTPVNLESPDDVSKVLYSVELKDKKVWSELFNLGIDANGKKNKRTHYSKKEFMDIIANNTLPVYKSIAEHCTDCGGRGTYYKIKKNGEQFKRPTKCDNCRGKGFVYKSTDQIAGLEIIPFSSKYVAQQGFATDKTTLAEFAERDDISEQAKEFCIKYTRRNQIVTYLSTFVNGIRNNIQITGLIHPAQMQTVTKTGRLASRNPNWHNQPRGGTFPIRRCVVSRWKEGKILKGDYAQLEFRAAGFLSKDQQIYEDIKNKMDIHSFSASYIECSRQDAKPHCVPLNSMILTRYGWKLHYEVNVGDEVLTYNQEKDVNEWQPLLEKVYFKNAEIISLENKHWNILCTDNHRFFGEIRKDHGKNGKRWHKDIKEAKDISSEFRIRVSSLTEDGISTITPNEAAILGWIWSDGWIKFKDYNGSIRQSNGKYVHCNAVIIQKKFTNEIETLLGKNCSTSNKDKNGCKVYYLHSKFIRDIYNKANLNYYNPDYVSFVLSLSEAARSAFLNAICLAEGTKRFKSYRIAQNSGDFCEAIKLAGFLQGYDVRTTSMYSKYSGKRHEQIWLKLNPYVSGQRLNKFNAGRSDVWCPRTKNNTWITKQNDTITILGNTFKPLYGGKSGTEKQKAYYTAFLERYRGVKKWHEQLLEKALITHRITLPTGRQYNFPYCRMLPSGWITNSTQIVNYPVQGFATADIVPIALVEVDKLIIDRNLKSLLINEVHDELVIDVFPGEEEIAKEVLSLGMLSVTEQLEIRYGIIMDMPLEIELSIGNNWLETVKC